MWSSTGSDEREEESSVGGGLGRMMQTRPDFDEEAGSRKQESKSKIYPGWIMSTPCSRAILMMSSWAR